MIQSTPIRRIVCFALLALLAGLAPPTRAEERAALAASTPPPGGPIVRYIARILNDQDPSFTPRGLNDKGQVVGAVRPDGFAYRAAIWDDGVLTLLPQGFDRANSITNAGAVVAWKANQSYIVKDGIATMFNVTQPPPGQTSISAVGGGDLNEAGQAVATVHGNGTVVAAMLTLSSVTYLPALDGTYYGQGAAINAGGDIVGESAISKGYGRATLWVGGAPTDLGSIGGTRSLAYAINDQREVVGYGELDDTDRPKQAFLWRGGRMEALPQLPGATLSSASDINNAGFIVGSASIPFGGQKAIAWFDGQVIDLNDRLANADGLVLTDAMRVNERGQILASAQRGNQYFSVLLSPPGVSIDSLAFQRQERDGSTWVDVPDPANVADGSPARVVAKLRNTDTQTQTVQLAFRDTTTDQPLPNCDTTFPLPPTPQQTTVEQTCDWDTAGMAWVDTTHTIPGTRHTIRAELKLTGATVSQREQAITVRPRPVIFVPGIGGDYAVDPSGAGDRFWLLNRGVQPDLLTIDPLIHSYDGLLETLRRSGYTPGRDLFIANYDWRLVPGPSDGVYDGVVNGISAQSIGDRTYQYGVDYLGHSLREAAEVWQNAYQIPLDQVDVIAHSTGGLVTRTYIQSPAYGGVYDPSSGSALPKVKNFVSVGVPHRGASKAWNPLHDNWGIDASFRAVLSKIINRAFQKVDGNGGDVTIRGPDGAIGLADARHPDGTPDPEHFIRRYVPTINTLLATYPFLDHGSGTIEDVNSGNYANTLLLDLNNGADVTVGRDPNLFLDATHLTAIGAGSEPTPTYVLQGIGPASNVLAPFTAFTMQDAAAAQVYYRDLFISGGGDGTVPTLSSVGQFQNDPRAKVFLFQQGVNTAGKVGHTDLTDNPDIQQVILQTLKVPVDTANLVSLGQPDLANISSIVLDPVQGFVVDAQGRRLGWSEATGPLQEIPGSVWRGAGDGFGLIFGAVPGALQLQLQGMDGPYYAQVQRVATDGQVSGAQLAGQLLARGATVTAPAPAPGRIYIYLPQVSAGGH